MPIQHVIFDLDGTLTDSRLGITRCWAHALTALGRVAPPLHELERYIGPPTREVAAELFATGDAELIERAVASYRERFATVGLLENKVYPGVDALLTELAARGLEQWICTSKPRVYAERIAEHFGFTRAVRGVYGPELDGTPGGKDQLLALLLQRERIVPSSAVMIGDRRHDAEAAHGNGTRCIGVLYGYGSRAELQAAGAEQLCVSVTELSAAVVALA
jgi:phosphoglycolate phosphatase